MSEGSTARMVSIVKFGRTADITQVGWQNVTNADAHLGLVAGVLVLDLEFDFVANFGFNSVFPSAIGITDDTSFLFYSIFVIKDRFDFDGHVIDVFVTSRDITVEAVVADLSPLIGNVAGRITLVDDAIGELDASTTSVVTVLKQSGAINVLKMERSVVVVESHIIDITVFLTSIVGFQPTIDRNVFGGSLRNVEAHLSVLRDVTLFLAVRVIVVNVETDDIGLAIFDRDPIAFPDVGGTLVGSSDTSANEVGLVAECALRDGLTIMSVFVPLVVRIFEDDGVEGDITFLPATVIDLL